MSDLVPVPSETAARALIDADRYRAMYEASIADPDTFWGEHGRRLHWTKPYTKVKNTSFDYHNVSIKWFEDGELNVSYNCIDRHLAKRGDQTAILWEGDDPDHAKHITYRELHCAGLQARQRAEGSRRRQGRPRRHLHADDPRDRLRHAGLRADRRRPLGGLRRLQPGFAGEPRQGLRRHADHHRRRGAARRPQGAAEGQCRQGAPGDGGRARARRRAHRRQRSR